MTSAGLFLFVARGDLTKIPPPKEVLSDGRRRWAGKQVLGQGMAGKREMIAYYIACHKNPQQVSRLVKNVYHAANCYLIHVDKKAPEEVHCEIAESGAVDKANIRIMASRPVDWGRWSQVQAMLRAIRLALAWNQDWTHFINLSGQDFPLKSQSQVFRFLQGQQDTSFIAARSLDNHPAKIKYFRQRYAEDRGRKSQTLEATFPDVNFHQGSQWMILSRSFCRDALQSELGMRLRQAMQTTHCSDEVYFQTLAANSKTRLPVVWRNGHLIRWIAKQPHPITWTIHDLDELTSGTAFFARKFDERVDSEIILALEQRLQAA